MNSMLSSLRSMWYSILLTVQSMLPAVPARRGIQGWQAALIIVIIIVVGGVTIYLLITPSGVTTSTYP